jgi:hypothetical protein
VTYLFAAFICVSIIFFLYVFFFYCAAEKVDIAMPVTPLVSVLVACRFVKTTRTYYCTLLPLPLVPLISCSLRPIGYRVLSCSRSSHKENSIYVFPEKKLRGLIPNFYIHISVSDLCIPTIGPHVFLQPNRQTDRWNL